MKYAPLLLCAALTLPITAAQKSVDEVTDAAFSQYTGKGKVIVNFGAEWCGYCKKFDPIYEKSADKHKDVKFGYMDVDKNEITARIYNMDSIPTMIFFKDGKPVARLYGFVPEDKWEEAVTQFSK